MDTEVSTDTNGRTFAEDILEGLSARQKYIPAEYHYDANGSRLFDRITELPEYYLTDCEIDALERNSERIASLMGDEPMNIIEFGPGDGSKTRALIEYFVTQGLNFRYFGVDISQTALEQLADDYQTRYPDLSVDCLVCNYATSLSWLKSRYRRRNLALFLGSSIGNFIPAQARSFLLELNEGLNPGDFAIIGFDLAKDSNLIHSAYNDSEDVTAEFNLNLLKRINRELGGEFDLTDFRYSGRYDKAERVHRSYLVSQSEQNVRIGELSRSFRFEEGETIHTEDSRKYTEPDIERLANETGYSVRANLHDSRKYFVDSVWEVRGD